jgi:hypothetical protein
VIDALDLPLKQKLAGDHHSVEDEQKEHQKAYGENSQQPFALIRVDDF